MSAIKEDDDAILLEKILTTDLAKQELIANLFIYLGYIFLGLTFIAGAAIFVGGDFLWFVMSVYTSLLFLFLGKARAGYAKLYRLIRREAKRGKVT